MTSGRGVEGLDHESVGKLMRVLSAAQEIGLVGKGDALQMVKHATGFGAGVGPPRWLLDIGSGGGLPGLVLAELWQTADVVLLDGRRKSVEFLQWAIDDLQVRERVQVIEGRAETLGQMRDLRGKFDLVTARGFAQPPVTAECGSPFLKVGGRLVVSEPPADHEDGEEHGVDEELRWPQEGVALLGLRVEARWSATGNYVALRQVSGCPERFPRRVGVPGKRPLF